MTLSLEAISDRLLINDIYSRYAYASDTHDISTLSTIFLPTTTFDWTTCGGGRMTFSEAKHGPMFTGELIPWSFHIATNPLVNFYDDGSKATVNVKVLNPCGVDGGDGDMKMFQMQGEYEDELVKLDGGWKIISRFWTEFFIMGPMEKINGVPGMMAVAGRKVE